MTTSSRLVPKGGYVAGFVEDGQANIFDSRVAELSQAREQLAVRDALELERSLDDLPVANERTRLTAKQVSDSRRAGAQPCDEPMERKHPMRTRTVSAM